MMVIEDPIIVGVAAGFIVWIGQVLAQSVIFQYRKHQQTSKLDKTLNDLHENLKSEEYRNLNRYNMLFEFESKLEGLVRYSSAVAHDKKADIHSVIKQMEAVLEFYNRRNYEIPEHASENDRSYLNIGPEDLNLIKEEIESIEWLNLST